MKESHKHIAFGREEEKRGKTHTWRRASEEDQAAQVRCALVAERAGRVDQSSHAVRLYGAADEGRAPGRSGAGGLLGLEELFLRIRGLGALVGIAEDGAQDGEGGGVVEDCAEGDSGGLHGREVCKGRR